MEEEPASPRRSVMHEAPVPWAVTSEPYPSWMYDTVVGSFGESRVRKHLTSHAASGSFSRDLKPAHMCSLIRRAERKLKRMGLPVQTARGILGTQQIPAPINHAAHPPSSAWSAHAGQQGSGAGLGRAAPGSSAPLLGVPAEERSRHERPPGSESDRKRAVPQNLSGSERRGESGDVGESGRELSFIPPEPSPAREGNAPLTAMIEERQARLKLLREKAEAEEKQTLSSEQEKVLGLVMAGQNVFFTGPGGTGKSFLLKRIVQALKKDGSMVAVTATTGIAAVNINGRTIHSFSGIETGVGTRKSLLQKAWRRKKDWRETDVLVLDEVSMMPGILFQHLNYIAQEIRGDRRPFGGIQLVLCGDFFQLPPVTRNKEQRVFAFEVPECHMTPRGMYDEHYGKLTPRAELTKVFRQSDEQLVRVLNHLRHGHWIAEARIVLQSVRRPLDKSNGVLPTVLFCTNVRVDDKNMQELRRLPTEEKEFKALDAPADRVYPHPAVSRSIAQAQRSCLATAVVNLKVGAQVMLLRNLTTSLVNGSRGVVTGWLDDPLGHLPSIVHGNDRDHKAETIKRWLRAQTFQKLPLVQFETHPCEIPIEPVDFGVTVGPNEYRYRTQIPLKLCWAITVHKSQGMTLDKVEMDISRVFEPGQAYVALSRCSSLGGMHVIAYDARQIKADVSVLQFAAKHCGDALAAEHLARKGHAVKEVVGQKDPAAREAELAMLNG